MFFFSQPILGAGGDLFEQYSRCLAKRGRWRPASFRKPYLWHTFFHARRLEVVRVLGDGNCLFRSIAHQVYGVDAHHALVRAKCVAGVPPRDACFVLETRILYISREVSFPHSLLSRSGNVMESSRTWLESGVAFLTRHVLIVRSPSRETRQRPTLSIRCMDYVEMERAYFEPYVEGDFDRYVAAKRRDGARVSPAPKRRRARLSLSREVSSRSRDLLEKNSQRSSLERSFVEEKPRAGGATSPRCRLCANSTTGPRRSGATTRTPVARASSAPSTAGSRTRARETTETTHAAATATRAAL